MIADGHRRSPTAGSRRRWGRAVAVGLAVTLAGCALTPSEFVRPSSGPVALANDPPSTTGEAFEIRPAVLVEETVVPPAGSTGPPPVASATAEPLPLPAPGSPAPPPTAFAAPAPDSPPAEPKSRLLSPEEKARVIAELEALARNQKVGTGAAPVDCEPSAEDALDPKKQPGSELATGGC